MHQLMNYMWLNVHAKSSFDCPNRSGDILDFVF